MHLQNKETILKAEVIIVLTVMVLAIYWQVAGHQFILYDDEEYVLINSRLRLGFTFENIYWFLTNSYASNWHPITWFSHILDLKLFGIDPTGHHLVNVILHLINSILLFLFLHRFTGSLWRSAAVAALLAVHPLNVESVAWVAERKNVLSSTFWILTLHLYAKYTERKNIFFYILSIFAFILGLMSKQMLVSIPFILLLLDYWPLKRIRLPPDVKLLDYMRSPEFRCLIIEKIPFLLFGIMASIIAVVSQEDSMGSLSGYSLTRRFANASTSYIDYLHKILWPHDLAVFYPFPDSVEWWSSICSTALLIAITVIAIKLSNKFPVLFVGWFWYIVAMFPVIGIVKIGLHSMADRYAYVPTIGIFIVIVWALTYLFRNIPRRKLILTGITTVFIIIILLNARHHTSHWKSTSTLFTEILSKDNDNYIALCAIGELLEAEGKYDAAMQKLDEALVIAPWYEPIQIHQGIMHMNSGMLDAAENKLNMALKQNPDSVQARTNLGIVMATLNRPDEAIKQFRIAIETDPESSTANYNLAFSLQKTGNADEAIIYYAKALATDPLDQACHNNMGITLAGLGKYAEAIRHFKEALRIKPDSLDTKKNLELVLQREAESK